MPCFINDLGVVVPLHDGLRSVPSTTESSEALLQRNSLLTALFPLTDDPVTGTIRHLAPRNMFATSLNSFSSTLAGSWLKGNENAPPGLTSQSLLDLVDELEVAADIPLQPCHIPRKACCGKDIPTPSSVGSQKPSILDLKDLEELQSTGVNNLGEPGSHSISPDGTDQSTQNTSVKLGEFDAFEDAVEAPLPKDVSSDGAGEDDRNEQLAVEAVDISSLPPFKR